MMLMGKKNNRSQEKHAAAQAADADYEAQQQRRNKALLKQGKAFRTNVTPAAITILPYC